MQKSILRKTCGRVVAIAAVAALVATAATAGEGTDRTDRTNQKARVQVQLDGDALKAMRQSPMAAHLRQMAEELRMSTEARILGKAAPELASDDLQIVTLPSGITRARLGVSQLNTALVRFAATGEAVHACVDGAQVPATMATRVAPVQLEVQ